VRAATAGLQTNPFPGLRPFREDEEHLFFGRENQVDAMVDKLAETRFLAVVGTSGSGKSSLVNCGLRPALRQGLMARAGTAWRMAQFRPGNDPIGAMARELAQDGVLFREHAVADLPLAEIIETTLRMSRLGLIDACEQAGLGEGVNLLVVVDQLEELFRYRQLGDQGMGEQAAAFVNLLLEVKERANCPIYVVLTMRSDFLGDCTQFPGLAEAINAGQYLVPRMTRDERRAAIERPVEVAGAEMSPVLLTRLVNDVGDNPDQLSILQHALNRTWARWQNEGGGKGPLDLSHYEAIGTMAHALDQHAEKAYAELGSARQQQICERLFKALTDKTDPRGLRRPTTLATLCALADATTAEVTEVIDVFRRPSRSFLMPPVADALKVETVIDISHESLMRVWERLIKWADEEAASARSYRRLAEVAELHAVGNANLWRDPELQLALNWRDKNQPNETWASRYHPGFATALQFLMESSKARDAERAERQQQRQRELDAEHEKAEVQARNARRSFWAAVFSSALALVAVVCAVIAVVFGVQARKASVVAEASRAEAQLYLSEAQITQSRALVEKAAQDPNDHSRRILLALEALPDAREGIDRPVVFEAQKILSTGIDGLRELQVRRGDTGPVLAVAISPDGARIIKGSGDNAARVLDANTGVQLLQLKGHTGPVRVVTITLDGARLVTGSDDGTVRVWEASTGAELLQLKGHSGPIRAVAVTPNGARIITGCDDNTARVWDAGTGAELFQLTGNTGPVLAVAVTRDGTRIVTGSADYTARVWDASTGAELLQLKGHTRSVLAVAITPDGSRIITGSEDNTARVWDASNGHPLYPLRGHTNFVRGVAVTPDGARVVTGSSDNTARVWDTSTGVELLQLKGHTGRVLGVAVTPDGARIITGSEDDTIRVWDARADTALLRLEGHTRPVLGLAVTSDGGRIITGSEDNTAGVWDASTGAQTLELKGHDGLVRAMAVTRDGGRIVTGSADNTARVWDARTGAELLQLKGHTRAVWDVAVTPDGARIVTGSADNTARVWDASTGAELLQLKGHVGRVFAVAVTPDGARIITGSADNTARVWNANTGAELLRLRGHASSIWGVAVTPDGARIVTSSSDNTARVWDANTGAELLRLKGHTQAVWDVTVTPDGARIVTGSDDSTARVWDANTGVELLQLKGSRGIWGVAVMPDGARIVTSSADNSTRVWALAKLSPPPQQHQFNTPLARQALVDQAKGVVPRCLTIEQRMTYLLAPRPPGWCIDMHKYPYDTEHWKAWKAGNTADAIDRMTAQAYGSFADAALKAGDFRIALEAAELGIKFDPKEIWITMNQAHAHMFLGRTEEARKEYLAHRGETPPDGSKPWEELVVDDFQRLRDSGREHPLMDDIRREFKSALPVEAGE
jgi:WD40 repeat protein/energy-coupling factor transporter ATP-binding protein EcfA2